MQQIVINLRDDQKELADKVCDLVNQENAKANQAEYDRFDKTVLVWDRIRTVEDAIAVTGMELPENIHELPLDIQAYIKLRIICAAYNELKVDELDRFPTFKADEWRYYPYFILYTEDEVKEMSENQKKELWLFGGYSGNGANCGIASAASSNVWSSSISAISARLAFKSRELAVECLKHFPQLWAHYLLDVEEIRPYSHE